MLICMCVDLSDICSTQFWDYVDSDDEEFEKDAFEPVVLTNKRSRKPSQKLK